jgi:hypothetical protein
VLSINWSDAAIVGALIGGGFALVKELTAFLFRRIESYLAERRRRITVKARIAQFFAQMAIDATRTLAAWQTAVEILREMKLLVGPQPPPIEFLRYEDPTLLTDAVVLADEFPDVITALTKIYELKDAISEARSAEQAMLEGISLLYTFPRTRRLVWGLGELGITYLERVVEILPQNPWDPDRGARASFKLAAANLRSDFRQFPLISEEDMRNETLRASAGVRRAKVGAASVPGS